MTKDQTYSRHQVWEKLRQVARPDSRFHFDFGEYITDFEGSDMATQRLTAMDIYQNARVVFITPDNCLEMLRAQTIRDNKVMLMTTYGIRRGFVELHREDVPQGLEDYVVLLDVIEKFGRYISLAEIQEKMKIDLLVTGGSAISAGGVRVGKGHGFFDMEWAMLYSIGAVNEQSPIVDIVHDCQVVEEKYAINPFDTICDYIITPTRTIHVPAPQKPTGGIYWEMLQPGMMESISPLAELKQLEAAGKTKVRR